MSRKLALVISIAATCWGGWEVWDWKTVEVLNGWEQDRTVEIRTAADIEKIPVQVRLKKKTWRFRDRRPEYDIDGKGQACRECRTGFHDRCSGEFGIDKVSILERTFESVSIPPAGGREAYKKELVEEDRSWCECCEEPSLEAHFRGIVPSGWELPELPPNLRNLEW